MIVCSIGQIACIGQDSSSLKAGIATAAYEFPKGVWLSYDGFRKVLYERDSLGECRLLLANTEKIVRLQEFRIEVKNVQVTSLQNVRQLQSADIKKLKRLVWKKNFEMWAWRGLTAVLAFKLIF